MLLDTKIGEDIGGEAPSVEAKIRKLTIAVTGGTADGDHGGVCTDRGLQWSRWRSGALHQGDDEADDQDH